MYVARDDVKLALYVYSLSPSCLRPVVRRRRPDLQRVVGAGAPVLVPPRGAKYLQLTYSSTALKGPALVGAHSTLADSVLISQSVLGTCSAVGRSTTISQSYIFDNCRIGANCLLNECIVGEGVEIADGVEIGKGALIGDGVKLGKGVRVPEYSRVGREVWRPEGWEEGDEVEGEQAREGVYYFSAKALGMPFVVYRTRRDIKKLDTVLSCVLPCFTLLSEPLNLQRIDN